MFWTRSSLIPLLFSLGYLQICHSVTWFQYVLNPRLNYMHYFSSTVVMVTTVRFRKFQEFCWFLLSFRNAWINDRLLLPPETLVLCPLCLGPSLLLSCPDVIPSPYFLSLPPALRDSMVLWSSCGHVTRYLYLKALIVACFVWWLLYCCLSLHFNPSRAKE